MNKQSKSDQHKKNFSSGDAGDAEQKNVSRRTFLKYTSATALGLPFLSSCSTTDGTTSGNSSPGPRYAFIGTGGRGSSHVSRLAYLNVECPCFCDVDTNRQRPAGKHWPNAKAYQDYRRMYDEMSDELDAVFISTPDHHHFPAAMMALQRDLHVYCEKPLTWSPWEARQLQAVASSENLVTQMGNQRHQIWERAVNLIRMGLLGDVKETHSWTTRPSWPQGIKRPDESHKVPERLDWNLWIGPAEKRPYVQNVYHPTRWRGWFDFGAGALGDMACHILDGMFWATEPDPPKSVELVNVDGAAEESFPAMSKVRWTFPASDDQPSFEAYWYDGNPSTYNNKPDRPEGISEKAWKKAGGGNLFIGTEGTLFTGPYGRLKKILPAEKEQEFVYDYDEEVTEPNPGHHREFLLSVNGDYPPHFPKSNFSYAAPLTEIVLLGVLAQRRGKKGKTLKYDASNHEFLNDEKINQWMKRDYREGWDVF